MITVETMVTRLEHGDDKEHAATFAYTSTAFPMLTGTLVTVAGFVPIGFAHSAAGEYTFSIFAVVAIALLASWVVAVLFAPLLGVWVLKKPKAVHSEEPGPIMRGFRRVLALAMRARWVTLLSTLGLFGAALYGMRFVPQQFFPSSDRPELLVDLQLPENASIYATRDVSARLDKLLKGDPDVDHWSAYVGQGAVRFYLPLNVQLPNDFFAQAVVVTKGLEQRERVKAKLEQALATEFPNVVGRVYPLELGPPVGWPLQYRVSGREPDQVRAIAFKVAESIGSAPGARERQLQLDGAGAHGQDPGRPGSGPPSGAELAGSRPVSEHGRVRRDRHADAQRHLSRRRAGPGLSRAAHVAGDHPGASGPAAERTDRSPRPDRLRRLWPGVSDSLAPGPAADRDGAGRCHARHSGRHGRTGSGAEDRRAERRACRAATASKSAGQLRRATKRRRRSPPSCL